ncbi:hypothetical protein DTO164E3_3684 [Paecilomyces variotii]|nr:hypothetical protein DTO164E3_3684 [Paecilomyces variotii]KAJ9232627.1 hypothetical protein DTO169E5_7383 [Paecilomyces variotii]KAJ9254497.1 hypothetical protein DTO195F2_6601 [Paecilomyces variotii]KAJ9356657.1 hypothetical protein DTO027B9_3511 [Paecilomyces variotii]
MPSTSATSGRQDICEPEGMLYAYMTVVGHSPSEHSSPTINSVQANGETSRQQSTCRETWGVIFHGTSFRSCAPEWYRKSAIGNIHQDLLAVTESASSQLNTDELTQQVILAFGPGANVPFQEPTDVWSSSVAYPQPGEAPLSYSAFKDRLFAS